MRGDKSCDGPVRLWQRGGPLGANVVECAQSLVSQAGDQRNRPLVEEAQREEGTKWRGRERDGAVAQRCLAWDGCACWLVGFSSEFLTLINTSGN